MDSTSGLECFEERVFSWVEYFFFFFFLEKKILSDEGKFGIVSIKLLLLILIQSKVWCLLTNRKRKMKNNGAIVS